MRNPPLIASLLKFKVNIHNAGDDRPGVIPSHVVRDDGSRRSVHVGHNTPLPQMLLCSKAFPVISRRLVSRRHHQWMGSPSLVNIITIYYPPGAQPPLHVQDANLTFVSTDPRQRILYFLTGD